MFVHNTVSGATLDFDVFQPGSNSSAFLRRNVFVGGEVDTQSAVQSELNDNILFGVTIDGAWDQQLGNLDQDPSLADGANGDISPLPGSPAREMSAVEDPVFALFDSLYGLDIRVDRSGSPRPQGDWDAGAVETAP